MYNTFAYILHLLVWSQVNLSTVSRQRSFYPAVGLKTSLKLTQDALLTPPPPQSIYVGIFFPTALKANFFESSPALDDVSGTIHIHFSE